MTKMYNTPPFCLMFHLDEKKERERHPAKMTLLQSLKRIAVGGKQVLISYGM